MHQRLQPGLGEVRRWLPGRRKFANFNSVSFHVNGSPLKIEDCILTLVQLGEWLQVEPAAGWFVADGTSEPHALQADLHFNLPKSKYLKIVY